MTKERSHYIVPATAGWFVAMYVGAGPDCPGCLAFEPIIAWEIERSEGPYHPSAGRRPDDLCLYHGVIPITVEGNMDNHTNPWAIKRPDGTYIIPQIADFKDDAEVMAELHEQWQKDDARRWVKRQAVGG